MWYDEVKSYNFGYQGFSMATGHFTQVVWKETTHVGLSASSCGNFIFANYFPAGNMAGSFERNVLPLNTALDDDGSESDDPDSSSGEYEEKTVEPKQEKQ